MMHRQRGLAYGGSIGAVFPALNEQGDVHYVQTRYLNPGTGPKYDNPAASLATNPRLAWSRSVGNPEAGHLVVCEGIPDASTAAGLGHLSVAILGSQSPDHSIAARSPVGQPPTALTSSQLSTTTRQAEASANGCTP